VRLIGVRVIENIHLDCLGPWADLPITLPWVQSQVKNNVERLWSDADLLWHAAESKNFKERISIEQRRKPLSKHYI
jgi:RNAse (barnase) inhibitor barstar